MRSSFQRSAIAVALGWLVACGLKAPPMPPQEPTVSTTPLNPDAVAGVADPALRQLLHDHWERTLERSPLWATQLGDHRYDDRIGDSSAGAYAADRQARDAFLARAEALSGLTGDDALTLDLFVDKLRKDAAIDVCRFETWGFSPTWNPISDFAYLPELHGVETVDDGQKLLARYRQIPRSVDETIANLRVGLAEGRVGTAHSTRLAIEMADEQLAKPLEDWTLLAPAKADRAWDEAETAAFREGLNGVVEADIAPAYRRWRDFLAEEVLPVARDDAHSGIVHLPDGEACYAATIRQHTSLPLAAGDVHATGLAELERIHGEMRVLGERLFGTDDLAAVFERLRTDPALYFTSEDEVEAKAQQSLDRAKAAIPAMFGRLPQTECVVRRIPDYEAPYTYIAYYRQPNPDGSKPGEYFVNTYKPETRPRYEAEVLAFHESIPGHHLQIAIAQELEAVPAFRKHLDATAYVEGWALYTESLADEMGLYSGDLDRLGRLSFDSWRASRLVVDTGIHAKGWSREQAVRFMLENTPLAENNIRNEVDRYVNWPGQALGYKTGQLEILRLRRESEAALGERFDLAAFHDALLESGPLTLPVLSARIEAWAASR